MQETYGLKNSLEDAVELAAYATWILAVMALLSGEAILKSLLLCWFSVFIGITLTAGIFLRDRIKEIVSGMHVTTGALAAAGCAVFLLFFI